MRFPRLETERLILRQLSRKDRQRIVFLLNNKNISQMTGNIPHPYNEKKAIELINGSLLGFERRQATVFGIVRKSDNLLIGKMGIKYDKEHHRGDLGYWIGEDYWGNGFATEALIALMAYEFSYEGLHKIEACHFGENLGSARVLQKAGLKKEAEKLEHFKKDGRFLDVIEYGLLRADYLESRT